MEFCFLLPGHIQHLLFLKEGAYDILNSFCDTSISSPSQKQSKKQIFTLIIKNKQNPRRIFSWMLLNCKEFYLREYLGLSLAFARSVVILSCLQSGILYFAPLLRRIRRWVIYWFVAGIKTPKLISFLTSMVE